MEKGTENHKENASLKLISSTDLLRVGSSISLTNKILYGNISKLFNIAFCKLNSKLVLNKDLDYLSILETNPNYRQKYNYLFEAHINDDYRDALDKFTEILERVHIF